MSASHYAHSVPGQGREKWQELCLHLENVAASSAHFASHFGGDTWAHAAGLWHDLGKYSAEFQSYIVSASDSEGEDEPRRGPDHSTAGAQHATATIPGGVGHLLAYIIAGHHAGLADGQSTGPSCIDERLKKRLCDWRNGPPPSLLSAPKLSLPPGLLEKDAAQSENAARLALFLRFVFSAVVDADFLDTEAFLSPERARARTSTQPSHGELEARLLRYVAQLDTSRATASVNAERTMISDACLRSAELTPGFFSLTVPTGGGKTLSSLRFALRHSARHNLRRIIYAIPFTSIVEQNAAVFRAALGDDAVLEHHSNFDPRTAHETPQRQLAAENWDAPVVVTTNVQLLESLFAARPSRCRKLHRLARSVIILDEAQVIPIDFLKPCLFVLRELVRTYGCTVVLCTATQPAIHLRPGFEIGIGGVREIVVDPGTVFRRLERVSVERRGKLSPRQLAETVAGEMQALAIVRTRREAADVFRLLPDGDTRYHLSGLMCAAHRSAVLDAVRRRLTRGETCRLVSTNLIEAGVDVDFPVVFRALAGLDAVAQAAGRCNRGGLLNSRGKLGRLIIYGAADECPVGDMRQAAQHADEVLRLPVGAEPLSMAAVEQYFLLHYWSRQERWDANDVLGCFPTVGNGLNFQFATCAERFRLIEDAYRPVIVPYDDYARTLIAPLFRGAPAMRATFRGLQRYTVTIPERLWARHVGGAIQLLADDRLPVLIGAETLYDKHAGLRLEADTPVYDPGYLQS